MSAADLNGSYVMGDTNPGAQQAFLICRRGLCDEPPADTWPRIVLWQDLINYREGLDAIGTGENLDIIGDCQPSRRVGSCNELH